MPIKNLYLPFKSQKIIATVEDVERVDKPFMNIGEAAEHLRKYEEKFMTH